MKRQETTSGHISGTQLLLTGDERERLLGIMRLVAGTLEANLFLSRIEDVIERYRREPMDVRWMKERRKTLREVATLSASLAEQLKVIGDWDDEGILALQPWYNKVAPSDEPVRWWGDERTDLARRLTNLSAAAQEALPDFSTPSVRTHREDLADLVRWLLDVIVSHYHGRIRGRSAKWRTNVTDALGICLLAAGVQGGPQEDRLWRDYVAPELNRVWAAAEIPDK